MGGLYLGVSGYRSCGGVGGYQKREDQCEDGVEGLWASLPMCLGRD